LIAYKSTLKGLGKLKLNEDNLTEDLDKAWEVMAEPIQTVMRKAGIEKPYEKLKALTRGQKIDRQTMIAFIDGLELQDDDKQRLKQMSPASYTGIAAKIVDLLD
jgi:adenylosuccinate lyase